MLLCLVALIALASTAFGLAQRRREARWRAGLLNGCAVRLAEPCLGRDRAGFATLRGQRAGAAVDVRLLPDTLVHRRLPQLWLRVTLRRPLAVGATLDVLRRPVGAEFYTPDALPIRHPVPETWPPDTLVRGTAGAADVLARAAPALGRILADPRVKNVLVTPGGVRLTVQASQGARGRYLLLRESRFPLAGVGPELLDATLRDGLSLILSLSDPSSETRHAQAA